MQVALLWVQLVASAIFILAGARYLTNASDVIARRTGLGRTFAGMILLATATSLPELGTGISSISLQGSADLAAGAAFGSNLVNLGIIGVADIANRSGPILGLVPRASLVVAGVGAAVIALASAATFIHHQTSAMATWYISPLTGALFALFALSTFAIYRSEEPSVAGPELEETDISLARASVIYGASALVVIASSVWLSFAGAGIADALRWEESFVGTQFLAISTSLPEIATSITAVRIGAPALAVGNLLGSNLFNMGFILSADELAVTDGTIWAAISSTHVLTGLIALAMTAAVACAVLARRRLNTIAPGKEQGRWMRPEAVILIAMYVGASVGLFYAG